MIYIVLALAIGLLCICLMHSRPTAFFSSPLISASFIHQPNKASTPREAATVLALSTVTPLVEVFRPIPLPDT